MASTEQLPSGRWRGIYRDAAGKRRTRTHDTKRAAERWANVQEDRASRGHRGNPNAARAPWSTWFERWEPTRNIAASTRRFSATKVRLHVRPRWDPVPLAGISRLDVQAWVTRDLPAAGLSASSIRQCFYILSASMKAAVVEGLLESNPCVGVRLPALPPGRERYLSDAEVGLLLYRLDEPYRTLSEFLLGTGLRLGEACGLHRARLDLETGVVRVAEAWDGPDRVMLAFPKGKRARTVPLPAALTERLRVYVAAHPAEGRCGETHAEGRCPGPLLFTGPSSAGVPIDTHNFTKRVWAAALRESKVEHCTPHDLRHTYASRLVQRGVELVRVRDLLGHASITMTERYAHLIPDQFDRVRAALDGPPAAAPAEDGDGGRGTERGTPEHTAGLPEAPLRTHLRSV